MLGTLSELAGRVDGKIVGDKTISINGIAAVSEADDTTLTFATSSHYFVAALASKAAAILVDASLVEKETYSKSLIVVESARYALVTLLETLHAPRPKGPFRHSSAVIEAGAVVADDVYVGAHVYIGAGATIGAGCAIDVSAYVGAETTIGAGTWLHPHARVLERCVIGERVVLHSGCVVGSEGFGWAFIEGRLERIPQVGNVVLDDEVEIGANTCVDRAQTGSTRIGAGTKIDNLCQIGHNCRIGAHSVIAAFGGLAGTTVLGDFVKVGGNAGFVGHLTVGSRVTVAGGAQVWGDVPDGATVSGVPARDHREHLRREVMLRNLPKLIARVEALERGSSRERE